MKKKRHLILAAQIATLAAWSAVASDRSAAAPAALEKFKALEGAWEGVNGKGQAVHSDYRIVADGSAVMETFSIKGSRRDHEMITVYHLDGERIMLTHYCSAGNQPRMRSLGLRADGQTVSFDYVDVTNVTSPNDGHMHRAVFRFIDQDRIETDWTWYENGKPGFTESVELKRKAPTAP